MRCLCCVNEVILEKTPGHLRGELVAGGTSLAMGRIRTFSPTPATPTFEPGG